MKHRVVSLFLALILLVSLLVMPASAASAKDVHSYLTQFAKQSGSYDEDEQGWYSGFQIASSSVARVYFVVYYMKNTQYVHCSAVYLAQSSNNLSFEVTWKISSNPSPAYNAYVELYDYGEPDEILLNTAIRHMLGLIGQDGSETEENSDKTSEEEGVE